MGVLDTIKDAATKTADAYKAGTKQTEGMGAELAATAQMNRLGEQALKPNPPTAERDTTGRGVGNKAKPYGSQGKEKRIDVSGYSNPAIPVHDKGGKIVGGSNANLNDGKHQLGILKEGERVLTEKQNEKFENTKVFDKGGKVATPFDMITGGKKNSAEPADLDPKNGTSTSTGGATATGNSGAATGGAVTVTISGSSSTGTSTETSTETGGAGAGSSAGGKGKGKGAGKDSAGVAPDTGDKRPHVYNITVNSTGQSGDVGEGESSPDEAEPKVYDNGGKVATPYDMITGGKGKAPKKEIKEMVHTKSHNGKHIVTHKHHSPMHHPDEMHAFNDMDEAKAHMDAHAGAEPAEGAAPLTAAPSPEAAPAAAPAAGGMPAPGM